MSCVRALSERFYASKKKKSKTLSFEMKCRGMMDILDKVSQIPKGFIKLAPVQQQKLIGCKWRGRGRAGNLVNGNWANSLKRLKAISDPATYKNTNSGSIFLIVSEVYPG